MNNILSVLIILIGVLPTLNAQQSFTDFFNQTDALLKQYVQEGQVNYQAIKEEKQLGQLTSFVAQADLSGTNKATTQAFYINAYNLIVIEQAAMAYPLSSVLNVNGFFDAKKHQVAGEKITLNQLEKDRLLKTYGDPRFHFVLVCGALDCPPITNFAYRPVNLESQLEAQTRTAINDPNFIKVDQASQAVDISQIFEWYADDFGGNKTAVRNFINQYKEENLPEDFKIGYYRYDWTLNDAALNLGDHALDAGNSSNRYVVSAAIAKGTTESKLFNNLYTQRTGDGENLNQRSTFFTSSLSFLFGVSHRFNAGFDLRYRRVRNDGLPSSAFDVFGAGGQSSRQGVTSFGPKIRWAPSEKLPNFSIQSAFWFPIGEDLEGNGELPFIDWNGATWWTQFFNDFTLSSNFSLFTEIDVLWEDIGSGSNGALNRVSTPATAILSYFPNPKTTLYGLTSFSPFWQTEFDYFAQAGVGAKYQFTRNFEVEILYTAFTNDFLQQNNGNASTFNIGIRVNR